MNMRLLRTIGAAFLVSQILAIVIHGVILFGTYGPFYGTLLRSTENPNWRVFLFPIPHLLFVSGLAWVFSRLQTEGSRLQRGLALGVVGWLVGQAPLWLTWWIEQPWPDTLVVKQLGLEFVSSLLIGLTIAFVWGRAPQRRV